jgi:hypothetical protein
MVGLWHRVPRGHGLGLLALGAICAGGVVAFLLLGPLANLDGSGLRVAVPACPTDADGCFAAVIQASDEAMSTPPVLTYHEWAGGSTTLDFSLASGNYAVYLDGCEGYAMTAVAAPVHSGYTSVHLSTDFWDTVGFLDHACPAFYPLSSEDMLGG